MIDREDGPFDCNPTIAGVDEKSAPVLFGCVNDDISTIEVDGGAALRGAELEFGTLIHLDDRSIREADQCPRSIGGAHRLAGPDHVTGGKGQTGVLFDDLQ